MTIQEAKHRCTKLFYLIWTELSPIPGRESPNLYNMLWRRLENQNQIFRSCAFLWDRPFWSSFRNMRELMKKQQERQLRFTENDTHQWGFMRMNCILGIPEMLSGLKQRGYKLAIASSKPENFVKIVAEYFHIDSYFDEMVGSEPEGRRTNKTEVIEETLKRLGLSEHRDQVIMVVIKSMMYLGQDAPDWNALQFLMVTEPKKN